MPKSPTAQRLKPRKLPVQARSAHTVEAVLEAAARIIETQGLAACTTNAIAERAGVSIGSLYQYFPNRDALTVALIERETAQLLADVERAGQEKTAHGRILDVVRASVAHQMRRPVLARLIDFEEKRLPLGDRDQRVADTIHAHLASALQLPDAPRLANPALAAYDLLAIVHGMVDAAGERGELDAAALERRVMLAVSGYLHGASSA